MSNQDESENATSGLTSNEIAAGGPIPGDLSLIEQDLAKSEEIASPGFYPSINAAEVGDASRSALFPAASFTGSLDGPNQVYAWRSADQYQGCTYLNTRRPGEIYIVPVFGWTKRRARWRWRSSWTTTPTPSSP